MSLQQKMQLRPALLVCVAIASGLMSGVHLYLVYNRGSHSLSVALEIPVERGSTNVELNIHSVRITNNGREGREQTFGAPRQSSIVMVPADVMSVQRALDEVREEEVDAIFGDNDGEEYEVLLETGEYELEEKDMDKTDTVESDSSLPPPTDHRHMKHHKRKRKAIKEHMRLSVTGTYSSQLTESIRGDDEVVAGVPSEENRYTSEGRKTESKENFLVDNVEERKVKGAFVISKEDYYARQATSTNPPPITHSPHPHTHKNHTHTPSQCSQPPCTQFLSAEEKLVLSKCQKKTVSKKGHHQSAFACKCRFRSGVGMKRVALVSLPGSGNTWVRGLLEKASGLCTGSIYCDGSLRDGGFCGEGLRGSSVLAVKTHDTSLQWRDGRRRELNRPVFDKVIFLIRNPFKANIAEWNRQISKKYASDQSGSSHVKYVSNEALFGNQGGWQTLVKYQSHKWRMMLGSNMRAQAAGWPVLPVFFEDIKTDAATQLTRMMEFLDLHVTPDIINATVMDGFTSYYRNHTDHFNHYTPQQRLLVNSVISTTADALQDKTFAKKLREYIHH